MSKKDDVFLQQIKGVFGKNQTFIKNSIQIRKFLHLCDVSMGLFHLTLPKLEEVTASMEFSEKKKFIKDMKQLAKEGMEEYENGCPRVHNYGVILLWSALEAFVEDFCLHWIMSFPEDLDQEKKKEISLTLEQLEKFDEEELARFKVKKISDKAGTSFGTGIGRFAPLLNSIGFKVQVSDGVATSIKDLQQIRHVLVHKFGVADQKFIQKCVRLGYSLGDKVEVSFDQLETFDDAINEYVGEIGRIAEKKITDRISVRP